MRRILRAIALITFGAVVALYLTTGDAESPVVGSDADPVLVESGDAARGEPLLPPSTGDSELVAPLAPDTARAATVRRLADGDSFDIEWVDDGSRDELRLFGMNAPEGNACFGPEARDALTALLGDQSLVVEAIERDEFGRLIANVWVGDVFVNAAMIERGAALARSDGGPHQRVIDHAQTIAMAAQVGLWSPDECGAQSGTSLRIAAIEADAPGRDDQNPNGEWIVIENTSPTTANLTDWAIRDESTRHRFDFPVGFLLGGGDQVRVFSGCGDDAAFELYWCGGDPIWNNGGDTGFLVDPEGRFAATYSYGG